MTRCRCFRKVDLECPGCGSGSPVRPTGVLLCPKSTFSSDWLPPKRRNWSPLIPALTSGTAVDVRALSAPHSFTGGDARGTSSDVPWPSWPCSGTSRMRVALQVRGTSAPRDTLPQIGYRMFCVTTCACSTDRRFKGLPVFPVRWRDRPADGSGRQIENAAE